MAPGAVVEMVTKTLEPQWWTERERLDKIDRWYRRAEDDIRLPAGTSAEKKGLLELARTPWLGLVVTTAAQMLYVDGYRSPEAREDSKPWDTWLRNDLESRQIAIHRAALAYGYSYETVLPGVVDGARTAVMRGISPREMFAAYQDPAADLWPDVAMRVKEGPKGVRYFDVYDDEAVHHLAREDGTLQYIDHDLHGAGVCPVVRFVNLPDLEGRTDGEVEPFVPTAARINKTTYDRLLAQHFNSWRIITATGLEAPSSPEETAATKMRLRQEDVLTGEEGVAFGSLPETQLQGFIEAWRSDIETLAAVSQTPSHNLTGQMINLSAEALAAAESMMQRKVLERRKSLGVSHEQALRLAAHIEGDAEAAADFKAHVTWQDLESRSLAQAVDAWGKAVQMLGIPARTVWGKIPGISQTDVQEMLAAAAEQDVFATLLGETQGQQVPGQA